MADVFISYSHEDRSIADQISAGLRATELSVWYDTSLSAGETFQTSIEAELRDAKAVVVIWTTASWSSRWVRGEAAFALEDNKLIPVFASPLRLAPPFNTLHAIDFTRWNGDTNDEAWRELARAIQGVIGGDVEMMDSRTGFALENRADVVARLKQNEKDAAGGASIVGAFLLAMSFVTYGWNDAINAPQPYEMLGVGSILGVLALGIDGILRARARERTRQVRLRFGISDKETL